MYTSQLKLGIIRRYSIHHKVGLGLGDFSLSFSVKILPLSLFLYNLKSGKEKQIKAVLFICLNSTELMISLARKQYSSIIQNYNRTI